MTKNSATTFSAPASKVCFLLAALAAALPATLSATDAPGVPEWIWATRQRQAGQAVCFRQQFEVPGPLRSAQLTAVPDYCHSVLYLNGQLVARGEPYGPPLRIDVLERLRRGENTLGVCCRSVEGPAAVMLRLEIEGADGTRRTLVTDPDWKTARLTSKGLLWLEVKGAPWQPAVSFGPVVPRFWGLNTDTAISPLDDYTQWKRALQAEAGTDPATFQALPGFRVELIRSAAADEDSWVSLAPDPQGRWVIGMEKRGLLRLTLPREPGGEVRVERINDQLQECRGLLFAYGALYAMANNDKALYRLRDTDGDDTLDEVTRLIEFPGDVGHGRNQLALGPDGFLYGICGDAVFEPQGHCLPPAPARPTPAERTRSGYVARFDKDGGHVEVLLRGLRNPFGIDFNPHGEMFTYDADAEYDMGSSWYRPTRINHLLPGGDYGWRRVTKTWPPYFPDRADMPRHMLDIGKGSPTAVCFGTRSNFPPPYRDALFALDWAYGRILAIHLAPRGASYAAAGETFLRGRPLNVTGAEFGPDGAMYFVTGGRGTQSALYRVQYVGREVAEAQPTAQQAARETHAAVARRWRRKLTGLIGSDESRAIETAWPHLASSDPWLRHAARTVVESQPAGRWRKRALAEVDAAAALAAMMGLLRVDDPPPHAAVAARLAEFDWQAMTAAEQLDALFLCERCLSDEAKLETGLKTKLVAKLRRLYPADDPRVNRHVSRLLAHFPDENFVSTTLGLLQRAKSQNEQLHYLFVLRDGEVGWTPEQRKVYFQGLRQMDEFVGGEGMPAFRRLIREAALASLPEELREAFAKRVEQGAVAPDEAVELRTEVVRKWTADELLEALNDSKREPDSERGRRMFAAARCSACHRHAGRGGVSGPDLTSVARRFTARDALVSMIEPSKVIAQKYSSHVFELADGRVVTGSIVPGDYRSPQLSVMPNLLDPRERVTFNKADVVRQMPSPVSPMPKGLLDVLTKDEILDLLAYLLQAE